MPEKFGRMLTAQLNEDAPRSGTCAIFPERGIARTNPRVISSSGSSLASVPAQWMVLEPAAERGKSAVFGGDPMEVSELSGDGTERIRILLADDHPVVRGGLAAVVAQEPDLLLVAEAENGERAVALFREHLPDVVVMDLRMPLMGGVEAIRKITEEFPAARVLALTTYEGDADIRHALEAGARGYLLKDMLLTDVITAIRAVRRGDRVIPTAV